MKLSFATNRLQKQLTEERELKKCFTAFYKPLQRRMFELASVDSLFYISPEPPPRRHLLKGKYLGCFGIDVTGNFRIVIQPVPAELPQLSDGSIDYKGITHVKIVFVGDYHGE